jgi:predicted alpha/beta-fold hydrolase
VGPLRLCATINRNRAALLVAQKATPSTALPVKHTHSRIAMEGFVVTTKQLVMLGVIVAYVSTPAAARQTTSDCSDHTLATQGISLYYKTCGQGPPLLLLHRFFGTGTLSWGRFIPTLAAQYRLIVPDLRGHGRSTNPSGEFTHRQSATDMFALLDSLGLQQVKAMGISSGGMTLLHITTQQPSRIDAMVLVGATTYFPEQARKFSRF